MADTIQRVEYFYAQVPNKAGEGARFLTALQEAGINLLAFSGFPEGRGSQLDFVPADPAAFKQFARTDMSHELRTPLNAIIGFSEVLADSGLPIMRCIGPGEESLVL
jgi:signal transduction histidine kinase